MPSGSQLDSKLAASGGSIFVKALAIVTATVVAVKAAPTTVVVATGDKTIKDGAAGMVGAMEHAATMAVWLRLKEFSFHLGYATKRYHVI